jgi:hypothetical protein
MKVRDQKPMKDPKGGRRHHHAIRSPREDRPDRPVPPGHLPQ